MKMYRSKQGKGDAHFPAFQTVHTDFVGAYETEKGSSG
jgi:hypothetical protein